jgi:ferredoxin-NADP reductase
MTTTSQITLQLPVTRIALETPDTKTYRLDLGAHKPFPFLPGQFIILTAELWNPKRNRAAPVNRAFSISSSPTDWDYLEVTAKRYQDGRISAWLHDTVKVGDQVTVKGPAGKFVFNEGETDELVLIAGGIGVAPFRSMIRYIIGKKLPVRVHLLYTARTPQDFAYKTELDGIIQNHPNVTCLYSITRPSSDPQMDWSGRIGRVDEPLLRQHLKNPKALFYLCGPDVMIGELARLLKTIGVEEARIRFERW